MSLQKAQIVFNTNNDQFWGCCKGGGENVLGKLLVKIRENLSQHAQTTEFVQWKKMALIKYRAECNWYFSVVCFVLLLTASSFNKVCSKGSAEVFGSIQRRQRIPSDHEKASILSSR